MKRFLTNQKQVWDSLKKKPGFVFTVVATMGITLGALLCILTLAYLLFLKPLPYPEQENIYKLENHVFVNEGKEVVNAFSYPGLIHLYKKHTLFSEMALLSYVQDVLTSHPSQPTLDLGFASPELFPLVGGTMALGRGFDESEGLDNHHPVAILSYDTWMNIFSGDENILNRTVDFTGVTYRIIGVLSKSFIEPQLYQTGMKTQIWLPWDYSITEPQKEHWARLIPKLILVGKKSDDKAISLIEQINTKQMNEAWKANTSHIESLKGSNAKIKLVSFREAILGESGNTIILLIVGVIGLVLIATVNITNLFMSRTAEQQRILAIRAALGATKNNLFRTLLAESSQLMFISILIALPISAVGFQLLQHYLSDILPRVEELSIGAFTFLLSMMIVVIFALAFATFGSRLINYRALNLTLQSSGKGTGVQVSKKIRRFLIASQVAIATILIFVNVILFNHAVKIINEPMGFSLDNIQRLNLSYSADEWPNKDIIISTMTDIEKKLEQFPQVELVSRSNSPLRKFYVKSMNDLDTNTNYIFEFKSVNHNYFEMICQAFLEGDDFSEVDQRDHNRVIIINDEFAKKLAPNGSAVGKKLITRGNNIYTVIGVVSGIKQPGRNRVPLRAYSPAPLAFGNMMIKLKDNQLLNREQVVSLLQKVDKMFTVGRLDSLEVLRNQVLFPQYVTVITTAILAILSLFIAAIGLYGIISYSTQMRKSEFGTRMAIGADKGMLIRLVLKDNVIPVAGGILFSLIGMLIYYISQTQMLREYINVDTIILFSETLISILLITFIACYLPLSKYVNKPIINTLRG